MRLLIWCPTISLGGGDRLLFQLVRSFLENPGIEQLGIVVPEQASSRFYELRRVDPRLRVFTVRIRRLRQWTILSFLSGLRRRLQQMSKEWERKRLQRSFNAAAKHFDLVYVFWAQHE